MAIKINYTPSLKAQANTGDVTVSENNEKVTKVTLGQQVPPERCGDGIQLTIIDHKPSSAVTGGFLSERFKR